MRWSYGRGKGGFYIKQLSLRDAYILRRLLWDIIHRVLLLPHRLWFQPPPSMRRCHLCPRGPLWNRSMVNAATPIQVCTFSF